jgi:hypothetical protein
MNGWGKCATVSALCAILAGCGGSPNTPDGSTVGSPGGPLPPPPSLVKTELRVTLPARKHAPFGIRPHYLSPNTASLSIGLASVNGAPASGTHVTVINTSPKSPNCKIETPSLICTASIDAQPGDDVFNVTTYAWPNATGSVLSAGSAAATIGSGGRGGVRLSNSVSLTIGGVIAKLSLRAGATSIERGKATTVPVTLVAYDASGAQIVGNSEFDTPVTLSIEGDGAGAFHLKNGAQSGNSLSILRPTGKLTLAYDGNNQASTSISLQASVTEPNSVSASLALKVSGSPPPLPPGTIYVLNAGKKAGLGATLTVYDGSHAGNVSPKRTLALSNTLYARSIAVDGAGNIYVGYLDSAQGFSPVAGTPDRGNEVAVYPPSAAGSDPPVSVITADSGTGTALFPIAMAFDSTGNLVTYGATNFGGSETDAVLTYAPGASGSAAPLRAWSFASPSIRYAGPTGLALDPADNFYVAGIMHTPLGPDPGIFVNTSANQSNSGASPSRTIPWDGKTQLVSGQVANVTLDPSGEVVTGNYALVRGSTTSCQAKINVFAGGATGGTTDVAPLRVATLSGVATSNPNCYSPSNPLAGFYPFVTAYGNSTFVADEFGNAIDAFSSTANGTAKPKFAISGTATGLDTPIGVVIVPPSKAAISSASGPARVRFVEGAPLLETKVGGAPVGLGTAFLSVNDTTVASYFPYGWITQFSSYKAGVLQVRVIDSLGYAVGPFKTNALAGGKSYSVVLVGTYPKYSLLTFEEPPAASGKASLAVYAASPSTPHIDFGTFKVSTGTHYVRLGSAQYGNLVLRSLGSHVSNTGAYVGTGKTPMTGGTIPLQSVDSFDRHNVLPFHNAGRLSLFVLDPLAGASNGPVFGIFDL